MIIYNCVVRTMSDKYGDIADGYVEFSDGKIVAVGNTAEVKNRLSPTDIDGGGRVLCPGFVDPHAHIGVFGDGLGFEAMDANEISDPVTAHLRAIDAINPMDRTFGEALMGGVTTVVTGVGSANAIGGSMVGMKTYGSNRVDKRIIKSPLAIKMALGENPKNCYHDRDESPSTRMATAATIREQLAKAKRYRDDIKKAQAEDDSLPEFDAKCEALLPLLNREIPAHIHCHRADDIFTAIRLAEEFELDYVLVHATESALILEDLQEVLKDSKKPQLILGPILCDRSKPEMSQLDIATPAKVKECGLEFALCTDHPVIPIQYLPLCAGIAMRGGLDEQTALRAITIDSARAVGLDDRVGSIEVGKDADLVMLDGDFYSAAKAPVLVIAGGRQAAVGNSAGGKLPHAIPPTLKFH